MKKIIRIILIPRVKAVDLSNSSIISPGLYGEQIILLQYFAHIVELLASCKRKLTQNLEGGLVSCLTLLNHIIAYLSDSTVMDVLHVIHITHIYIYIITTR